MSIINLTTVGSRPFGKCPSLSRFFGESFPTFSMVLVTIRPHFCWIFFYWFFHVCVWPFWMGINMDKYEMNVSVLRLEKENKFHTSLNWWEIPRASLAQIQIFPPCSVALPCESDLSLVEEVQQFSLTLEARAGTWCKATLHRACKNPAMVYRAFFHTKFGKITLIRFVFRF